MAYGRARRTTTYGEFWPGYVDVLSTLLLVVTFLMSVFMVAQFYVSQESTGKDTALRRLTRQIAELTNLLSLEKGKSKSVEDELAGLQASLASLRTDNERLTGLAGAGGDKDARIAALSKELADKTSISNEALAKVDLLNQQLLASAPTDGRASRRRSTPPRPRTRKARRASPISAPASTSCWPARCRSCSATAPTSSAACASCCATARTSASSATASCSSPRCCFPSGQATMSPEGLAAIDQLATTIVELERSIPKEIDWALQVDGHTDVRPIASAQFPSNWELSSARATSVVKYLISRGVSPKRLVAAGYGEFQPLEDGTSDEALRRNRRIELKLTNR